MISDPFYKRIDPTQSDEGHQDVDPLRRTDLGSDLMPDAWLIWGVGQESRVEKRDQRLVDSPCRGVRKQRGDRSEDLDGAAQPVAVEIQAFRRNLCQRVEDTVDGSASACRPFIDGYGPERLLYEATQVERHSIWNLRRMDRTPNHYTRIELVK